MNRNAAAAHVSARAKTLLKMLVEHYIREGAPVGSRTLSRAPELALSAATIRNVMSDLDEVGLTRSPHTSAGRIPTVSGYRFFVDTLLTPRPLGGDDRSWIEHQLRFQAMTDDELLHSASNLLSSLTHMAGVVTVPKRDHAIMRRIEFLPLSENRVLAILIVNQREVENRILQMHRPYSASELNQASNYLNTLFAGQGLTSIREALLRDLSETRANMHDMVLEAVRMAGQLLEDTDDGDFVLAGGANLMAIDDLSDAETLRGLFEAFDRKRELLRLFEQCLDAEGVRLFIGEESGYDMLDECSVVTSPYLIGDEVAGVLGVIGPTRMPYDRIIPIVDATAHSLSVALNSLN
jgi:heat-inducible transcriptional repressor